MFNEDWAEMYAFIHFVSNSNQMCLIQGSGNVKHNLKQNLTTIILFIAINLIITG